MIEALETRGFRNLEEATWQPGPGRNLLLGANGSGKTSLLEATYLALTTRSFRTAQLSDCARDAELGFRVAAETSGVARQTLELGWHGGHARHAINGKSSTVAQHVALAPVLAWTAAEAELLTGAPTLRRRFLDRGMVGARPASLAVLSRYRQALAQKRELLAARGSGLEPWNELLAVAGAELIALRAEAVHALGVALSEVVGEAGLSYPGLELRYRPNPADGERGAAALLERFGQLAPAERRRRTPLAGPQRDDLDFRWRGGELRRAISAGERKALGLALLAAQGRVLRAAGRTPLYLLDDADTELDRPTLARTWRLFPPEAAVFASSNRAEVWPESAPHNDHRWSLRGGRVEALRDAR